MNPQLEARKKELTEQREAFTKEVEAIQRRAEALTIDIHRISGALALIEELKLNEPKTEPDKSALAEVVPISAREGLAAVEEVLEEDFSEDPADKSN